MRSLAEIIKRIDANRGEIVKQGDDGLWCKIPMSRSKKFFMAIVSWGEGWDHVSVSLKDRCPSWDEMCIMKDVFFDFTETVVQFHPPRKQYVNTHEFCLHLWRNKNRETELPPHNFV